MRTSHHESPRRPAGLRWGAVLLVVSIAAPPTVPLALAQSRVYRCTAPDGSIEFREHACAGQDQSRALDIQDTRTGWVPPAPEPEPRSAGGRKPKPKAHAGADHADRYAERCWKTRQQIERINDELRAGYTPARGEKLKRRRREYEADLDRYCR